MTSFAGTGAPFAGTTTPLAGTPTNPLDEVGTFLRRVCAALADLPLTTFLNEAVLPYETDEVTRLIIDGHDAGAEPVAVVLRRQDRQAPERQHGARRIPERGERR